MHLPLTPGGPRDQGLAAPHEEVYLEGQSALLERWRRRGVLFSFTGVGGDEMLSLPRSSAVAVDGQPVWLGRRARDCLGAVDEHMVPAPPVSDSTLLAVTSGAPMYLRAGVWPLYPLADPALFRFGQWLPEKWRSGKRLARSRLERLGLSRDVVYPSLSENFLGALTDGLLTFGPAWLSRIMREGAPLIEAGFLVADPLADVLVRLEQRRPLPSDLQVFHALALDRAVKAME